MSEDWLEDPFADREDPAAREREQRRLEREEKRRQRAAKQAKGRRERKAQKPAPPAPEQPRPEAPQPRPEPPPQLAPAEEEVEEPPAPVATEMPYHDEGDPAMAGAARTGRRSGHSGDGGRGGLLRSLARHPFRIFALLVAVIALWFLNALFQPFHGSPTGRVSVNIPKGAGVSEVADVLAEKGVIDSSTMFQVRVTLAGKRSDVYAGHYTLGHGMSYGEAIDALSVPPVKRTLTVTVPEGYSRAQAAKLIAEDGIRGSYVKATARSKYLDPEKYGGAKAKSLEGFLFPDTFELKPKQPVAALVQLQLQDFKRRIKAVDMRYAKSKNLNVYDVLTIASMVQDESGLPRQDKLVASVIYNRLHEGMPLGIDATIRYATGNYERPLTESQLAVASPYNTRTNAGLPPGPINSPGLQAIRAAAHPAQTGYLFYVTDPNGCNELTFAKTEAEFEAAVSRYNSAREAAGGNAPSTCGE